MIWPWFALGLCCNLRWWLWLFMMLNTLSDTTCISWFLAQACSCDELRNASWMFIEQYHESSRKLLSQAVKSCSGFAIAQMFCSRLHYC